MAEFLNVLLEKRTEKVIETPQFKRYDWRYENNLISGKKPIELDSEYNQWRTNSVLSNHKDLIFYINEMNINYNITNKMHYAYLFSVIRKQKRWVEPETKKEKTAREKKEALITSISEYYKYNVVRAKETLKVLTPEQIEIIIKGKEKGGVK